MAIKLVVMGVSGSGKSTVGEALAARMEAVFFDADDLHPEANVEKMSRGEALTDEDRWPWLDRVGAGFADGAGAMVCACSALRRSYRERIAAAAGGSVIFVHLEGAKALIADRMAARAHFMPVSLLDSQFATLETPDEDEPVIAVSIQNAPDDIVETVLAHLNDGSSARQGVSTKV